LFVFDYQGECFCEGITTPVPSLKEGGEPYLSAALKVKKGRIVNIPVSAAASLQFPSFLQGGDRGGSFCELVYTQKQTSLVTQK
jgi:hypothetical protein